MPNPSQNLYGLVLAGGKSSRMQTDKSRLCYHDKEQLLVAYELLVLHCEKVFISKRAEQKTQQPYVQLPAISDEAHLSGKGPLAGILSALTQYPQHAWLVLACDLPFVTTDVLATLIAQRKPGRLVTAFRSAYDGLPEPLCAIYEPECASFLRQCYNEGLKCPRRIISKLNVPLYDLPNDHALDNINTMPEYLAAKEALLRHPSQES